MTPRAYRLETPRARLRCLDLGCITQSIEIDTAHGPRQMILGFRDAESYVSASGNFGAIVGRVANRIGGARFTLDGRTVHLVANEGRNHLHGGSEGLQRQVWRVARDGAAALRFTHRSPAGAMGYPGAVDFTVTIRLEETAETIRLIYETTGRPDRPTPISLAQHNYWSPTGGAVPMRDHILHVPASRHVAVDRDLVPTGDLPSVEETALDFRTPRALDGVDHDTCLVLDTTPAEITLTAPDSPALRLITDQPGVQLYTAGQLAPQAPPLPGQRHLPGHAVCLEPQGLPDAVNHPHFPDVIATPDRPYHQRLICEITPTLTSP